MNHGQFDQVWHPQRTLRLTCHTILQELFVNRRWWELSLSAIQIISKRVNVYSSGKGVKSHSSIINKSTPIYFLIKRRNLPSASVTFKKTIYNVVPLGTQVHYTEDFVFIHQIKLVWLSSLNSVPQFSVLDDSISMQYSIMKKIK